MRNGFKKFISEKGFYLALAACLTGAGAAAWFAVDKTIDNIKSTPSKEVPQTQQEENTDSLQSARKELDGLMEDIPTPPKTQKTESSQPPLTANTQPSSKPKQEAEDTDDKKADSAASTVPPEKEEAFSISLPVIGQALASFSGNMLVKNETLHDWRTHNGIDLGAPVGTTIQSACDGTVTSVRNDPMWGNIVEVSSGEYTLVYAGVDNIAVKCDASIKKGDTIGAVGSIPCESSLEPHLHFDVKQNGKYIDPVSLAK